MARLGASHGYRFEGDVVHLNAMFSVVQPVAHDHSWALQLWACPSKPETDSELKSAHLVAEAPLPPIGEIADDAEHFEVCAPAFPPAGSREHVMTLALVSGRGREFTNVQDWAVYGRRERFRQPYLGGEVGYRLTGEEVQIQVEQIRNPRSPDNLSGTLSLELWALKECYQGGNFDGVALAGVVLSPLSGQGESVAKSFELPYTAPPAGIWHFTLMLREWTAAGFVTRDHVNFSTTVSVPQPTSPTASPPATPNDSELFRTKATQPLKQDPDSMIAVNQRRSSVVHRSPTGVSVNSATVAELRGIKGLPTKVAEGIVKKRPFRSFEDLLDVKGMGTKLLAKLRSQLKL